MTDMTMTLYVFKSVFNEKEKKRTLDNISLKKITRCFLFCIIREDQDFNSIQDFAHVNV